MDPLEFRLLPGQMNVLVSNVGFEEMGQWLRMHTALAKDSSLIPSPTLGGSQPVTPAPRASGTSDLPGHRPPYRATYIIK